MSGAGSSSLLGSISIRVAVEADLAAIARIHVATWQTCYRGIMPDEFLERLSVRAREEGWGKLVTAAARSILVCEAQGEAVGFAACGPTRDSDKDPAIVGELYAIYVLPNHWGQGCGHLLEESVEQELVRSKFKEMTLWVLEANARGRCFYARKGLVVDPNASQEAAVGGVRLPQVRYWKALSR